jgi:hypothetical protein
MDAFLKTIARLRTGNGQAEPVLPHRSITTREIGQERRLLQDFTTDNPKHVRAPAGTREHLPKSVDGNWGIANARDLRPIPPSSLWIDKASCLLFEGEDLALFVDKGSASVGQNDIWILFEHPNAHVQVGLMVEVIVGSPFKQGRRRELEHPIVVCDSPQVPLLRM